MTALFCGCGALISHTSSQPSTLGHFALSSTHNLSELLHHSMVLNKTGQLAFNNLSIAVLHPLFLTVAVCRVASWF
jgi:hypothetical protein